MSQFSSPGFTPAAPYPVAPAVAVPGRRAAPEWFKYITIGFLILAGLFWAGPQYDVYGVEYHIWLDYPEYHYFGSPGTGGGWIFMLWVILIAACVAVWFSNRVDGPLGRATWLPVPLLMAAIILVIIRDSQIKNMTWIVPNINWVDLDNDGTGAHDLVWAGLVIGMITMLVALVYQSRTPKAPPQPVFVVAPPPPPPVSPPPPPAPPVNPLAAKLAEADGLLAAGSISPEEHAALRQRILSGQ